MTRTARSRRFRPWYAVAAALTVLLLAPALWLLPRWNHEVISVDGQHRWQEESAPPRRNIVWQPAEPMPAPVADAQPMDSLVRPQWADGGTTLYYTVQRQDGAADIYRSRFDGQSWLPGQPVAELNSSAEDFGPVISADGNELYLYSDRPGGEGGFDLYVARRTPSGWSTPQNLGPGINSPANEYDAAVTPDGKQLFFASNRTKKMQQMLLKRQENPDVEDTNQWKATLRAEPGMQQFDLYVAGRGSAEGEWEIARPLSGINSARANEGEPYVSPDGAFLYFASDRANEHGSSINYDIYRARLTEGGILGVENLGTGVNTAANEHEPALSPEGFRIAFARDRGPDEPAQSAAEQYALYVSQAKEIYEEAYWDTSHIPPLSEILWWVVLALLILALLAALIWYLREVSLRRAPVPGFFLLALLLHILLLGGAFLVPLDGVTLAERIAKEFEKIVATDVQLESTHQSHERGQESYEKVADLQSVETLKISETPRRVTETPNVPVPTQTPAPTVPQRLNRESLDQRVATNAPRVTQPMQDNPQMNRRQRIVERLLTENTVQIEAPQAAEENPAQPAQASEKVDVQRTQQAQPTETNPLMRRKVDLATAIEQEQVTAERPTATPDTPQVEQPQQELARISRPAASMETPTIQQEEVAPQVVSNASEQSQPAKINLQVQRQTTEANTANPTQTVRVDVSPTRSSRLVQEPVDTTRPEPNATAPVGAQAADQSSLPRRQRVASVESEIAMQVPAEQVTPRAAAAESGLTLTASDVQVILERQQAGGPSVKADVPQAAASTGSVSSSLEADATAEPLAAAGPASAVSTKSADAPVQIVRRNRSTPLEVAGGPAVAETPLTPAESGDGKPAAAQALRGETIELTRSGATDGPAANVPVSGPQSVRPSTIIEAIAKSEVGSREASPAATNGSALDATSAQIARAEFGHRAIEAPAAGDIATEQVAQNGEAAGSKASSIDGVDVDIDRPQSAGSLLSVKVETADMLGGDYSESRRDLSIGELAKVSNDAEVSFSPFASRLARRRARAPFVLYAQDNIGLQSMLRLRVGDDSTKQDLIEAFGGQKETLPAIRRGLKWLANVQHEDGRWDLKDFPKLPNGKRSSGRGSSESDSAATGLALLPFLGDGHTHMAGAYQKTVDRGLTWLLEHQKEDGNLFTGGEGNAHMYSHGIAAIALCEAFGMTKDAKLHEPAQRAVDYIVTAQHGRGGWRYKPGQAGDTSVVGWQIMALKSAQMAGLNVPSSTLNKARGFLESVRHGKGKGQFGYQNASGKSPAMTAEGLLCMEYLGAKRTDPKILRSVEYLMDHLPARKKDTSYCWYYATQALFHMQGEPWRRWNEAMSDTVLSTQVEKGPNAGSWDPQDQWESRGGRIYSTSLRLLMLEVSFRHLPLYQALEQ